MSFLCCAVAVCRAAMPMHPKQNLAAANRYGAPLFLRKSHQRFSLPFLCSAIPSEQYHAIAPHSLPFLRLAALRHSFALPVCASQCRREAVGRNALPLHSSSPHRLCFAVHCSERFYAIFAVLCRCYALLGLALPFPICAARGLADPLPFRSLRCRCASSQITAMPLQCKSLLRYAQPSHGRSLLCLRFAKRRSASPCPASANQGRQCHALALSPSPHRRCK